MKTKTSITLSSDLIAELDSLAKAAGSRSAVIETALRAYFAARKREKRDRQELETINANVGDLNREALDVLGYQVEL